MKKLLSLLLAVTILVSCFSCIAFAEGGDTTEKHIITIEVPPTSTVAGQIGGDDTDMWDQCGYNLESGYALYTIGFSIPDRYFAFESYGTGNSSATYTVTLMRNYNVSYAAHGNYADGSVMKTDWITVDPGSGYAFRITNYSGYTLYIHLTYYSWA